MQLKSNAPEIKWIIAHSVSNDFAASLDRQLMSKGELTNNQIAAVARIIDLQKTAAAATVTLEALKGVEQVQIAFAKAQENGVKRPKLFLGDFLLKLAPATGRNAGAIYVSSEDVYLGKIMDVKFQPSRDCTDVQKQSIIDLCADPLAAAVAFGKRTGICACCNRELTNAESIDLGIGPICREKYFG